MGQNPADQTSNGGQSESHGQQTQHSQQTNQAAQTEQSPQTQQTQPSQGSPQGQPNQQPRQQRDTAEQVTSWFTETLVRTGVAVFGVALLLLALGQLVGVNLLETVAGFLASGFGVWLVIAFFAMLLIVAASKSWNISRQ